MPKNNDGPKKDKNESKSSSIQMKSPKAGKKGSSADRTIETVEKKRSSADIRRSNIEMKGTEKKKSNIDLKTSEKKSSNIEIKRSSDKLPGSSKKPSLIQSPTNKDPSLPSSIPPTKDVDEHPERDTPKEPCGKRFMKYLYDRDNKTCCGRTCKSWASIISYSIMYLIFLSTFTLMFLFFSLLIIKSTIDFRGIEKPELLNYADFGIGLTAVPTSESSYPLIWYQKGQSEDYQKYVNALDRLLYKKRRKREAINSLGPCSERPYGYGDKPCIIVKINKQLKWSGKPLQPNSTVAKKAPPQVQRWVSQAKNMLWLHCNGYHSYDREHIGNISYFPDPPGFDPDVFPLDMNGTSPLVAIQVSDFTLGVSLAIECKLWYDKGPSSVEFLLYVAPTQ